MQRAAFASCCNRSAVDLPGSTRGVFATILTANLARSAVVLLDSWAATPPLAALECGICAVTTRLQPPIRTRAAAHKDHGSRSLKSGCKEVRIGGHFLSVVSMEPRVCNRHGLAWHLRVVDAWEISNPPWNNLLIMQPTRRSHTRPGSQSFLEPAAAVAVGPMRRRQLGRRGGRSGPEQLLPW